MSSVSIRRTFSLLVADEDRANREAIEAVLSVYGYRISTTGDGIAAWTVASGDPIDLAIVDVNLPALSGFDFIARCRVTEAAADLPILAMSTADDPETCERAFSLGATAFQAKPLQWPLLTHNVWYLLRNHVRDAELRSLKTQLGIKPAEPLRLAR